MKRIALLVFAAFVILSVSVFFVSAAEENVALGMTYTYTGEVIEGENTYPDTTPGKLTDGRLPTEQDISYSSGVWIGLNQNGDGTTTVDGKPMNSVVLDLEEVKQDITKVVLFAQECGAGISKPSKVEVFKSDDNKKFSRVGSAKEAKTIDKGDEDNPTHGIYTYTVNRSFDARYVKLEIYQSAWAFIGEVEVYTGGEVGEDSEDEPEESEESEQDEESEEESEEVVDSDEPAESKEPVESDESKEESVEPTEEEKDGFPTWAIILIVVVVLAVIGAVISFTKKKKD